MKTTLLNIRIKIAFFALIICSLGVSAQSTTDSGTKIMQDLAARYKTFATMQIDYTYKVESNKKITKTQTGKAQIKGYRKVSFAPDATLKDFINRPFSQFETT